ncbi:hypothetical protein Ancab_029505, partial [Ancistrocladus abbreviatus]
MMMKTPVNHGDNLPGEVEMYHHNTTTATTYDLTVMMKDENQNKQIFATERERCPALAVLNTIAPV